MDCEYQIDCEYHTEYEYHTECQTRGYTVGSFEKVGVCDTGYHIENMSRREKNINTEAAHSLSCFLV